MASRASTAFLVLSNLLIPIAILTFASGFFPYKPFLPGLAQYEALDCGPLPEAPFDKVVFMVVDALRSDFVYGNTSGFAFTQSLIRNGAAIPFTAHATSPTITMPRIKAITTGSIPSFLDVILNFAESDTTSSLATQDTWLAQLKAKGKGKMVMYGDETWLKLFPDTFDRADGTSSFFVADFTEVDNNVTRHIPDELARSDWDTMVLHYLGLDHIGHKAGPRSPNMVPKQREMDGVVKQIYEAMEVNEHLKSTLLVLAGDHGMNDAGNHGGSAPGETSPALVFVSPKLKVISSGYVSPAAYEEHFRYYSFIEQSDIAPTLGALLGFPAPRNNLGAFMPEFLPFWPSQNDKIQILLRNAKQILTVVTATFPSFEDIGASQNCGDAKNDVDELACQWKAISQSVPAPGTEDARSEAWVFAVTKWLKQAQEIMSSAASNYNVSKLVVGIALAACSLFLALASTRGTIIASFTSCSPLLAVSLLYGIMMFASSYVEEEQHFWYWTTSAWLLIVWAKCARKDIHPPRLLALISVLVLGCMRIARRWNQTGQKLAGSPDIAKTFFSNHRLTLWSLVGITYLWNLQSLASRSFPGFPQVLAAATATSLATASLTFKLAFTNEDSPELLAGIAKSMADNGMDLSLVVQARTVFIALSLILTYTLISGLFHKHPNPTMRTLHSLLTLLLITQSRATNIPLLLIFEILSLFLSSLALSPVEATTTSLLLQYTSFFASGGSNAISSIDLSSAYNGVSGFNVVAVGVLTFISNWSGPLFFVSSTNLELLRLRGIGETGVWKRHIALLTVFTTTGLLSVMLACTVLRVHLFIWTVFSPKYLYEMAWCLGMHLAGNVCFGGLLYWLGTKYS